MERKAGCFCLVLAGIWLGGCAGRTATPGEGLAAELLKEGAGRVQGNGLVRAPGEESSPEVLLAAWSNEDVTWGDLKTKGTVELYPGVEGRLTPLIREKLLQGAVANPMYLQQVLRGLPETAAARQAVRALYDRAKGGEAAGMPDSWERDVHEWLMWQGDFREDLIAGAKQVAFENHVMQHQEDLEALARLDWPAAEGIVAALVQSKEVRVAVLAECVGYGHAMRERQADAEARRAKLLAVAEDKALPGVARGEAFEALLAAEWEGVDAWAVKTMNDQTLWDLKDEGSYSSHLDWPFADWLKRTAKVRMAHMEPLLVSGDATTRVHAATLLFKTEDRDVMVMLLRHGEAVADLDWVGRLQEMELPVRREGLLELYASASPGYRWEVAKAMARQKMPEGKRALREILELPEMRKKEYPMIVLFELWRGEALTDAEWAWLITGERWPGVLAELTERDGRLPRFITMLRLGEREELAAALMRAMGRSNDPKKAEEWMEMAETWPAAAVDGEIMRQLMTLPLEEKLVKRALGRPKLKEREGHALRELARAGGERGSVAAAILEDAELCRGILEGSDGAAAQMLLASARLRRSALPLDGVARLLEGGDVLLAEAAEKYLLAVDTPEAQGLVRAHHPGKLVVIGDGRMLPADGAQEFPSIKALMGLRGEMEGAEGPDEIFALCSWGGLGGDGDRIVRVRGGKATLTCRGEGGKVYERELPPEELQSLRTFLEREKADEMPSLANRVFDGWVYDYAHLTRRGGHMVSIDNPGTAGTAGMPQDLLVRRFRGLGFWGKAE